MTPKMKPVWALLTPRQIERLDGLTAHITAFPSFRALVTAKRGYRPTIRRDLTGMPGDVLASAYDWFMRASGETRTAYRG